MDIKAYIESGIIESYVMQLTSPEETADVASMMSAYPEIAKAVSDFEISLEQHLLANSVAPSPAVKQAIWNELNTDFLSVTKEEPAFTRAVVRRPATWKYLAATSLVVLLSSVALNIYYYSKYANARREYNGLLAERTSLFANLDAAQTKLNVLDSSMQMMKDTAMQIIAMTGKNSKATVYWNSRTKDVYLLQNEMAKVPPGKQYQLWAIVDGKPVDAGMIGDCGEVLCKMKNIPRAEAFAITLEKAGGSPVPTMEQLYVMGKI